MIVDQLKILTQNSKNKKIFNKKIYQFVKFNRFEMFTRITILDRFKIDQISWL
jgi:hypothetical protein